MTHPNTVLAQPAPLIKLFDFELANDTLEEAADWITYKALHKQKTQIAFLNAHGVNIAYDNPAYNALLKTVSRLYADGSGLRYAARMKHENFRDNVNGTDLFPVLCDYASQKGLSLYLLGGREGFAGLAASNMQKRFPDLKIAGTHHGYVSGAEETQKVIKKVNASHADIVLVGLSAPLQDHWISENQDALKSPVTMGVGGLFDYYSGRIPRAPHLIRKLGLEWVWRLYQEPKRMWRRYIIGNVKFMTRTIHLTWFSH